MAKLYFKYGTMNASKTANALMTKFNYEEKNKRVWLIKPVIDTRDGVANESGNHKTITVKSRIGLSSEAWGIAEDDNILHLAASFLLGGPMDAVIVDECQFLTEEHVEQLRTLASYYDIPVLCFGLRTDFRSHLFPGSKRLFEIADSISEIKTVCTCGNKSIINGRFDSEGRVITDGDIVAIGGNEKYTSLCWRCWKKRSLIDSI